MMLGAAGARLGPGDALDAVRHAKADVVEDGVRKQHWLLAHDRNLRIAIRLGLRHRKPHVTAAY